jgi:hypothetical protein
MAQCPMTVSAHCFIQMGVEMGLFISTPFLKKIIKNEIPKIIDSQLPFQFYLECTG